MSTGWFQRLIGGSLSEDEKELIRALEKAEVTKVEVVGRGTVVTDPEEVIKSDKYRELSDLAREVVK